MTYWINIIIRINVYVFINLYKKKILQNTRFSSITFKINIKKNLSICTLLESDNERLFKSIAHISCCYKRLSSSPIKLFVGCSLTQTHITRVSVIRINLNEIHVFCRFFSQMNNFGALVKKFLFIGYHTDNVWVWLHTLQNNYKKHLILVYFFKNYLINQPIYSKLNSEISSVYWEWI